jgi:CubicO group peptidase (beta-lactamase class C family)
MAALMDFVAYHDRTGADHQAHFNMLYPQGYRMISLSVYQRSSPLYAAVWVRRDGPDWSAVHGVDAAGYQAAFDAAAAAGFHPVILSAAGPSANPVFAGVFEQRPGPIPLTRFGLTSGDKADAGTIQHWDEQAHTNGWIMTCGAVYGDAANPAYAGIWPANDDRRLAWSAAGILDQSADYQARFDAQVAGWARPGYVSVSDDERYLSIFVDDQIGPWIARHGLTSAEYQAEFDRLVPLGFFPICVQGGGSGSSIRFAAIFARQLEPLARQWTTVGLGEASAVDEVMQETLAASNVRGAAIAVTDNTRLVFARGYTWAEPGYPAVEPTTLFRLASVSKTFAGVAAHQLIAAGQLRLTDTVQSILNLTTPTGAAPPDPDFASITVEDLLIHNSRLDPDFYWSDLDVAAAFNTALPVTEAQLASYKASQSLLASAPDYSNWGYALLGIVIAHVAGAPTFYDAIKASILDPLGITRARPATSLAGTSYADEAHYHRTSEAALDLATFPSVMTSDRPLVADVYGNIHVENGAAAGGLSSAAVDTARFVAAFSVNRQNPMLKRSAIVKMLNLAAHSGRPRAGHGFDLVTPLGLGFHCEKGGYLWTAQGAINFDLDGLGIVVQYNGVNDDVLFHTQWPLIQAAIHSISWPRKTNYFPNFGFQPFS